MPVSNRVINDPLSFNFSQNLIQKTTSLVSSATSYSATSYGDVIGTTGYRIWSALASGSQIVTPSTPWVAPLTNNFLPPTLFDAIILLDLDGIESVYSFSNSPDNFGFVTGNNVVNSDNLYWVNLLRCRPNQQPQSAQSPINYFFGGDALNYSGAGLAGALKLNLIQPVSANTTFTYLMEYVSTIGQGFDSISGSIIVTPTTPLRNIPLGDFPFGFYNNPQGHMKITVSCSNPNYRSMLNAYHWGLSS